MKNSILFCFAALVLLFTSCAKIYYSPDAFSIANNHRVIAIAPPKVSITPRKNVPAESIQEQQKTESVNFQKEMYSWMLKRKMQNLIVVEIQDVETTNAKLQRAGYYDGTSLSPTEIAQTLGVDGVITSNFALSKPMSEGAAVALGLIFGVWGSTNEATVSLDIHDRASGKMIWNFNHKLSGSTFSTPAQLVDALMRQASKKMPYVRE